MEGTSAKPLFKFVDDGMYKLKWNADRKYEVDWGVDDFYSLFYNRLLEAQKTALHNVEYGEEARDDEARLLADLIVWLLTRIETLGYDEKARANIFTEINEVYHSLGVI